MKLGCTFTAVAALAALAALAGFACTVTQICAGVDDTPPGAACD